MSNISFLTKPTKPVTLVRNKDHIIIQLDQLDGIEGVKILSREINYWLRANKKRTIKELAKKANLGTKTVSKIWYKETVAPRFLTCVLLFKALGFAAIQLHKDY